MSLEIKCPECGQVGNVPESAVGKIVKCPACGIQVIVTDSSSTSPGHFAFDPIAASEPLLPVNSGINRARSRVQLPAISLIVVAVIGLGMSIMAVLNYFQMKAFQPVYQDMGEFIGRQPGISDEQSQHVRASMGLMESFFSSTGPAMLVMGLLGFASGFIVLAGAISMMKLRWYPLAIIASVLAMIPVISPCCLLGLPFGIWSLVVLMQPDVRQSFS